MCAVLRLTLNRRNEPVYLKFLDSCVWPGALGRRRRRQRAAVRLGYDTLSSEAAPPTRLIAVRNRRQMVVDVRFAQSPEPARGQRQEEERNTHVKAE
jgi:hypothetical protein